MGFISKILGGQNEFKAQPVGLDNTDYSSALSQLLGSGQLNNVSNQQGDLAQMLFGAARGEGPSVAQQQLQNTTNRNISQGAGMIGSQRGINPALAARLILNNTANANQDAAGQGALLRAQEMANARGQLGSVLGTQRGQDISQINSLGGLQNQQNAIRMQNQQNADAINAGVSAGNTGRAFGVGSGIVNSFAGLAQKAATGGAGGGGGESGGGGNAQMFAVASGGKIPGDARVAGDSPQNDTVPAMLSPGEIVVPRTAAKDPEKAKEFIDHILSHKASEANEPTFGHVIAAQRGLHDRLSMLERMCYGGRM